jgi:ABC-type amino acid transport substrate-binding protein
MEIYQSVGRYLCATNDNLRLGMSYDLSKERNAFAQEVFSTILGNDFAFLMLEGNADLRDQFNEAIASMKADGTLDRLVKEQIEDMIASLVTAPITMPVADGARTIRVAVTGALPPMDYVAADGTPAGFNTAVLAEIASRTGLNIELVVVDSIGRAAALADGAVDAVFWTRTSGESNTSAILNEEERAKKRETGKQEMSEEESRTLKKVDELIDFNDYGHADMPEGTIITEPYFSDVIVSVTTQARLDKAAARANQ